MLRSYICHHCRSRLPKGASATRRPQWQSKATFLSLRNAQTPPDGDSQTPPTDSEPGNHAQDLTEQQKGPNIHYQSVGSAGATRQVARRYSRWGRDADAEAQTQNQSLDSFPQVAGRYSRRGQDADTQQDEPEPGSDQLEAESVIRGPGRAIDKALREKRLRVAWALFLRHYPSRTAIKNPAPGDIAFVADEGVAKQLADSVKTYFCNWSNYHVTPTQVLFRYTQLGIDSPALWNNTIGYLTDQLLWSISSGRHDDGSRRGPEAMLNEVLSIWRLLLQCKGSAPDPLEAINPEWPPVPDLRSFMKKIHVSSNFGQRLVEFHPQLNSSAALQFSAITLFNLFDDVNHEIFQVPDSLKEQTAPFMRLLTTALAGAEIPNTLKHSQYSLSFKNLPEDFQKAVIDQVTSAPVHAMKKIAITQNEQEGLDPKEMSDVEQAENLTRFYVSQIDNAVAKLSHVGRLEKIWETVQIAYKLPDEKTVIPRLVYNALLSGFMKLRQPDQTVVIWNHMIASGIKPELDTWNAMLSGCSAAKDRDAFNAVWDRMLKTGAQPDHYVWTTRVNGLIQFRQINMGLATLDEMGKRWLAGEEALKTQPQRLKSSKPLPQGSKVNVHAKPTVQVVNGALSAFMQLSMRFDQRLHSMQKILQWAGRFSIKPNVYTYNILMALYVEAGDYPTVFKLLRQMEREGIEGDLATYTTIVRAAFSSQRFDNLSQSQQANRILAIFAELEKGGVKLTDRLYSIAIDRLLKAYGNISAARTVIDHMSARKISPEPAVYASLITHYFQESPPNIEAVDGLLLRVFGPPRARTDKYFFDRVIEGYATHGEVGKMMGVLARMSSHGNTPGYRALTSIVKALADAGDWERARLIVRDLQNGEGVAKSAITGGRVLEQQFFRMVEQLGLNVTEPLAGEHLRPRAAHSMTLGAQESAAPHDPYAQ